MVELRQKSLCTKAEYTYFVLFTGYCYGEKTNEDGIGWPERVSRIQELINIYRILVARSGSKEPFGRLRSSWERGTR